MDIEERKRLEIELERSSIPYSEALFAPVTEADRRAADERFKAAAEAATEKELRIRKEQEAARQAAEEERVRRSTRAPGLSAEEQSGASEELRRIVAAEEGRAGARGSSRSTAEAEAEAAAQAAAEAAAEAARVSEGEPQTETSKIKNLEELREDEKKIEIKSKDFNEAFKKAIDIFKKYSLDFKNKLKDEKKLFDIIVLYDGNHFYIPKTDIDLYTDPEFKIDDTSCVKNLILSCIEYDSLHDWTTFVWR